MKSNPQLCTLQRKKNCVIRASPDLFRLVNIQGYGISSVGGMGGGGGGGGGGERTVS